MGGGFPNQLSSLRIEFIASRLSILSELNCVGVWTIELNFNVLYMFEYVFLQNAKNISPGQK
jgi:hypothetical protein